MKVHKDGERNRNIEAAIAFRITEGASQVHLRYESADAHQ